MSNKSINTKGLSRQLEDKANKLQSDLAILRENHAELKEDYDQKSRELRKAQEQIHDAAQDAEVREHRLKDQNELLRHDHQVSVRNCESLNIQIKQLGDDLRSKTEEKDLLHSRHDALTAESQSLQKDLSKAQSTLEQVEQSLEDERQHALANDRYLKSEAEAEINQLSETIDSLHRDLEDKESKHAADKDHWEGQQRTLSSQKEKADEQAAGLQRTISKLQETEGTLSGREMKLREALESEKQRFESEEAVLGRRIQELNSDIDDKRQALDNLRIELSETKEDLRISERDQMVFDEKVQALEDEIEVLQSSYDDDVERANEEIQAAIQEAESLQEELSFAKEELARSQAADADAVSRLESNKQLENEIQRASTEEGRLNSEIDDLRRKVAASSEGRDRELSAARQKIQRLEIHIGELEDRLAKDNQDDIATAELSLFQKDLATARTKETEYLQREANHKESIRDLKQKVARLERQLHEVEISRLATGSPQSSVGGSARKNEIVEVRRQLAEAHQQMKDLRTKSRENERELQHKLRELNQQVQSDKDLHERERDQLDQELSSCRIKYDQEAAKTTAAEKNVVRLRARVHNLEKDLQAHRHSVAGDLTMADERKDLHEMLKDAKLTAESLQLEISSRETLLTASSSREKELRTHIRRIREERNLQLDKSTALSTELEHLQLRYERSVDNLARQQKIWEEERKKITSGVRFANTSVSTVHGGESATELKQMELVIREKEKRHEGELKGLARQIQWLKICHRREEDFRQGLAHGKRYMLRQIEMHNR